MNEQRNSLGKELRIAHATDLHPDGGIAFEHSVALASRGDGALFSLHANPADQKAVRRMPDASELIDEWKTRGGSNELAPAEFHKVSHTCCDDPVDTLLDAMNDIHPNLLVVGKHPVEGMFKFLHNSVSESLALNAQIPALFLPIGGRGFVSPDTGDLELRKVLVPVRGEFDMLPVYEVVEQLLDRLDVDEVEIILLHVGKNDDTLDSILTPEGRPGWKVRRVERKGEIAEEIAGFAAENDIDLVAMGTRGQDSLLDIFRGSNTQRVVREATCPVLWVPLDSDEPSGRQRTTHR